MLKPKVTDGYAEPLNNVASDLVSQMKAMRGTDGIIPRLQDELFKWSLECKLVVTKLYTLLITQKSSSDWSRNNKHSRNFLWRSRFYGEDCKSC